MVLEQERVPEEWKEVMLFPYTREVVRVVSNYRPVSLTSQVCKLFESIVKDNLVNDDIRNAKSVISLFWTIDAKAQGLGVTVQLH